MLLLKECKYSCCPLMGANFFPWGYIYKSCALNPNALFRLTSATVRLVLLFKHFFSLSFQWCLKTFITLTLTSAPPPSGSRSHWFEISCVWYDVLNFDLKSCTFKDQGHLCICWTFTLSLIAPTIKETYLICWMFVWWYVVPFGLAVWWQPTFMFCFEK